MRWVDRGLEPNGVAAYRGQFIQEGIDYFERRVGGRPTDSYWRDFRDELSRRFHQRCGYCERQCDDNADDGDLSPTVDHFRPLSRYPRRAYRWTNWVYSCQRCNAEKADGWPQAGYVDPCAANMSERPDRYLDYDVNTGEIVPRPGIEPNAERRAFRTIGDLRLNALNLRKGRFDWVKEIREDLLQLPLADRHALADLITDPADAAVEFVGITRMAIMQMQQAGEI